MSHWIWDRNMKVVMVWLDKEMDMEVVKDINKKIECELVMFHQINSI